MTAAGLKVPPVPPAASAASAPAGRPLAAGTRLAWLYLRSRRAPGALLVLALCAAVLHAVLRWHLVSGGALTQQGPMVIEAGAAVLIAMTTHSPFGEAERATGRWLPYLRLGAALALTGIAIGALQLGATGASLPGGILTLARNVIGIAGIGLLASPFTSGLLAWVPPIAYLGFAEYALTSAWTNPWTWPVCPASDWGAWACAVLVFAVGLTVITFRGPRTSPADNGLAIWCGPRPGVGGSLGRGPWLRGWLASARGWAGRWCRFRGSFAPKPGFRALTVAALCRYIVISYAFRDTPTGVSDP